MTCPFCHSRRISCPTKDLGKHAQIKSGPATCLNCGAHEEKTGPGGKLYVWVKSKPTEE